MIKLENKPALKRGAYMVTISMAVIGVLFITGKNCSNVEKLSAVAEKQNISITQPNSSSNGIQNQALNVTSRNGQEIRDIVNEKGEIAKKEGTQEKSSNTTKKKSSKVESATTKKENKKSATKTKKISEVKISKTMNLTKRTGLSREDFIKLISSVRADTSGFFEKNAGKIYDLCKKYSINEIFFCGLISAESGWNIASNHRRTHNYISLMKGGKLIKYSSVNEGLEVAAQKLHYNYLTPGGKFYHGKTLAGVKTCFCPSGSWVNLVYGRMKQIL